MRARMAVVAACLSVAPGVARADDAANEVQAHQAYDRGTSAYRRKDYITAAREYAAADALSPNPTALQAAIDAAVLADDPVLGTQLLDRARGAPRSDALLTTMLVAEKRFAGRTGRVRMSCPASPCLATIDGAAVDPALPAVVRVGSHSVLVQSGGYTTTRTVTIAPDETVVVGPNSTANPGAAPLPGPSPAPSSAPAPSPRDAPPADAPAPAPVASADVGTGISPVWFFVGVGATAVAGGVTIASGADTASKHASFEQCLQRKESCSSQQTSGQSAQTRTNVLVGVTAVLGVATALTLPFVRWHGTTASVGLGTLRFDGRF